MSLERTLLPSASCKLGHEVSRMVGEHGVERRLLARDEGVGSNSRLLWRHSCRLEEEVELTGREERKLPMSPERMTLLSASRSSSVENQDIITFYYGVEDLTVARLKGGAAADCCGGSHEGYK